MTVVFLISTLEKKQFPNNSFFTQLLNLSDINLVFEHQNS